MLIVNKIICWIYGLATFGSWRRKRAITLLTASPVVAGLGAGYGYLYTYLAYGSHSYTSTRMTDSTR